MSSDEPTLKILLIGPSSGGKTSLLLRYVEDIFDSESSTATIGVDFKTKKVSVGGKPYRLLLFDTAGQERFRTLTSSYYRNAHGVILVYDISNRDSFLSMEHWFREAETYASPNVVKCLVGTKTDRESARAVKTEEGQEFADRYGALFVECSSKNRENVRRPFVDVVDRIVETPDLVGSKKSAGGSIRVDSQEIEQASACGC